MRKRNICLLCLAAVTLLFLLYHADRERFFPETAPSVCERMLEEEEQALVSGQIYKKIRKKDTLTLYLRRLQIRGGARWIESGERILVHLTAEQLENFSPENPSPVIGQYVTITGTVGFFQESPNPGNFNQKFYYQKQKIHAVLWEAKILCASEGRAGIREMLWRLRTRAADAMREQLGERRGGILSAMLLGETSFTDAEVKEVYQKSGIGHLLAISGLHISFLGLGLYGLLRKLRIPFLPAALAGCAILGAYVGMTGGSVSAVRAFVMFVIRMGAAVLGREYDGLTALAAAAFVILAGNPLQLFDAGFLLSFGAVLGIYGAAPLLGEGREGLRTALAVQGVLLPLLLYYYYESSPFSLLWNLAALPLASVVMGTGSAGVLAGEILAAFGFPRAGSGMAGLLYRIAGGVLGFYEAGSRVVLRLPGARWVTGQPQAVQIILYYGFLGAAVLLFRKRKEGGRFSQAGIVSLAAAAFLVLVVPQNLHRGLEVVMLDVGQGDCFYLRSPAGNHYLIDGGSSSVKQVGKYRMEPFLKSQGVRSLACVWVSHGDGDHLSGIREMLERKDVGVPIRRLVLPPEGLWNEALADLAETAARADVPVLTMEQGQKFRDGALSLTCLWPEAGAETSEAGNEQSMVLSLTYGEFDMLFTGDLEKEGERQVASLLEEDGSGGVLPDAYEVLKVAHHGSKNATGEAFLEAVRPASAFCSAGKHNRYGHPHAQTRERLAKWGVSLYNTKDRSAVKLYTDGKKYCILIP